MSAFYSPPQGPPTAGAGAGPPKGVLDFIKTCPPEAPTMEDFNVTGVRRS